MAQLVVTEGDHGDSVFVFDEDGTPRGTLTFGPDIYTLGLGDVVVRGDYAFMSSQGYVDWENRFLVTTIDLSDPDNPAAAATVVMEHFSGDVDYTTMCLMGDLLVVPYYGNGFGYEIVNISDPLNLVHVGGEFMFDGSGGGMFSAAPVGPNHFAMVGSPNDSWPDFSGVNFHIVDISDPSNSSHESFTINGGTAQGVSFGLASNGTMAYQIGWLSSAPDDGWVACIDCSNPANPIEVGKVTSASLNNAAAGNHRDGFLYVAMNSGLAVVSVSNPAAPAVVGTHLHGDWGWVMARRADTLYVSFSDSAAGFARYDVSTPGSPTLLQRHEVGGLSWINGMHIEDFVPPTGMSARISGPTIRWW